MSPAYVFHSIACGACAVLNLIQDYFGIALLCDWFAMQQNVTLSVYLVLCSKL